MKRVLVTGSRTWNLVETIRAALAAEFEPGAVLVHGACPRGADAITDRIGREIGYRIEAHPADWRAGRAAGYVRNVGMVHLGADVCLAFLDPCARPACPRGHASHGGAHCLAAARAAGIRCEPVRSWSRP